MSSPIGYNNPAYNHQFDSTLYDYQYVPEIDPDEEEHRDAEQEPIHLVHPGLRNDIYGGSEEFDASDESNQSIIVEECNNRRITLICDKRDKTEGNYYEDRNCREAYHHVVSLDSENEYRKCHEEKRPEVSQRHRKRLDPPTEPGGMSPGVSGFFGANRGSTPASADFQYERPARHHRYEDVIGEQEKLVRVEERNRAQNISRHRYAEITVDENGFPSIGNEIEIEQSESGYRIVTPEVEVVHHPKPRAASPVLPDHRVSSTFSPSKTYQRTISPRPPPSIEPASHTIQTKSMPIPNRMPHANSLEMAELSPPRGRLNQGLQSRVFQSPKRHPPIGAPSPAELQELQEATLKSARAHKVAHRRQSSLSNSGESSGFRNATPSKSALKNSVAHMFQIKTTPKTPKTVVARNKRGSEKERNSTRRNISNSFTDPPSNLRSGSQTSSPYRPTTTEKAKTAIITPILQKKNLRREMTDRGEGFQDFDKLSHLFQSSGNLYRSGEDEEYQATDKMPTTGKIRRNQSVPNFAQLKGGHYDGMRPLAPRKMDCQYSPAKSVDRFSPISRSRISLIDHTKVSWSNSGSDLHAPVSGCLILGAIIQIVTSIISCAICFYLFSKLGRRYYLDFGILAGFINFVLGVLGFRSKCWRWLPNRNYISGYIVLTTFSILTCAGFIYLIVARPMSGNPILDLIGGGICGISVLTIILSVTGLTMSGCCKSPPPDNRVNNI